MARAARRCISQRVSGGRIADRQESYPAQGYDGYGDGIGTDLRAFISDLMLADWTAHREALLTFWISGQFSSELPNRKPWLFYCGVPAPGRGRGGRWKDIRRALTARAKPRI